MHAHTDTPKLRCYLVFAFFSLPMQFANSVKKPLTFCKTKKPSYRTAKKLYFTNFCKRARTHAHDRTQKFTVALCVTGSNVFPRNEQN